MADFQQYTFQRGRQAGNLDLTEANAWESLSNTLTGFSQTLMQVSEKQKATYNAEVKEYVEGMESDIITNLGKVAIDRENDYEHYERFVAAYKKGTLEGIEDPNIKDAAGKMIDDKAVQYGQQVFKNSINIRNARQLQSAEDSLEIHAVDTEHLIDSTINTWHNEPQFRDTYIESMSPIFQTQRDMFANKIDGLLELGKTGDAAFKQEQALLGRFYKKAAMAELTANMEEGKGWQTIQDFNADPSKFFSSRPQLQALFPEVKVSMSDEDKTETFKEMMTMLNGYQGQQDRIADARAKDKLADQEFFYSNIQGQIADDPKNIDKANIQSWLEEGKLTTKQHDSLLKMVQKGGLYSEDDNIVSGLWDTLFDPTADQFAVYDQIRQAVDNNQITPATQKQMLATLRDGGLKDVTKDEDYQMAINEVKTEFRTTGPLAAFLPNESKNINRAIREIYELKKTLRPDQNFLNELDAIKAKYKRVPEEAKPKVAWSSNWSGTAEEPAPDLSKEVLASLLESNQITQSVYLEQFNAIDAYMESYNLRKSR
jgi:hypothetical protein